MTEVVEEYEEYEEYEEEYELEGEMEEEEVEEIVDEVSGCLLTIHQQKIQQKISQQCLISVCSQDEMIWLEVQELRVQWQELWIVKLMTSCSQQFIEPVIYLCRQILFQIDSLLWNSKTHILISKSIQPFMFQICSISDYTYVKIFTLSREPSDAFTAQLSQSSTNIQYKTFA